MKKIAFIGVGVMGKAMVQNLSQAGYPVSIYTRTKNKVEDLISDKIIWHDSVAECVKDQDIVMTMVGFPQDVEEIYFSSKGIIANAKKDCILIDFTTSSPLLAKKIFEESSKHSLASLDAPVSGGDIGAKKGTLSIMVGGDEAVFERVKPLFELLGKNITLVGGNGDGQTCKVANQIIVALNIEAVSEALLFASKAGADPVRVRQALMGGFASSRILEVHGERMIKRTFNPGFKIALHQKDLNLALQSAKALALNLPNTATCQELFNTCAANGGSQLDHSALVQALELMANHKLA